MSDVEEINTPPLTAQEFVGVFANQRTGIAPDVRGYLTNTPTAAIEIIAGSHVPDALVDVFKKSLFGGNYQPTRDRELSTAFNSITNKLTNLMTVLDPNRINLVFVRQQLKAEILRVIQLDQGLYRAYMALPDEKSREDFLDAVIKSGIQAFGRQKLNEVLVVSSEGSQYATLNEELARLESRGREI